MVLEKNDSLILARQDGIDGILVKTRVQEGLMDPGHYALWLIPTGKLYAKLEQLIKEMAQEFSAPYFEPHLTLLGGITGDRAKIVSQCEDLADFQKPFEIRLAAPGHLDDYYRSLFLHVGRSPALLHANRRARKVLEYSENADYFPHMSLLYGNYPLALKQSIAAGRLGGMNGTFSVDRFFLIDLAGEPQNWTRIGCFLFRKQRCR
jgi:2'-5' RNA ligase